MFVIRVKTPAGVLLAITALLVARTSSVTGAEEPKDVVKLRGRVLDPEGMPVTGANLYLHAPNPAEKESVARATTGKDGRFQISCVRSEFSDRSKTGAPTVTVEAAASGYGCDWTTLGEAEAGRELTLRLVKDDAPISGRILDREGKPVAGAKLRVMRIAAYAGEDLTKMLQAAGRKTWSPPLALAWDKYCRNPLAGQANVLKTHTDGRFRLTGVGRDRTVDLAIEGPGIQSTKITVMTCAGEGVLTPDAIQKIYPRAFDYLAAQSRTIRGVVRDKDSGRPVAGVRVWSDLTTQRATSDNAGRYELLGCPKAATYGLIIVPPDGLHFARQMQVDDPPGLEPVTADIELPRGIIVQGRVIEKASGKPVSGVRVSYYPLFENPNVIHQEEYLTSGLVYDGFPGALSSVLSGPDGSFALATLVGPGVLAANAKPLSAYERALITPKALEDFLKDRPHRMNSTELLGVYRTGDPIRALDPFWLQQSQYHALELINTGEKDKVLNYELMLLPPSTRDRP
jgi:protocatechuate 3,4-dioxygenase beta subunit